MNRENYRPSVLRPVEELALAKLTLRDFISNLTPEQLDLLWDLTDEEITKQEAIKRTGLSVSKFNTLYYALSRKAIANLEESNII